MGFKKNRMAAVFLFWFLILLSVSVVWAGEISEESQEQTEAAKEKKGWHKDEKGNYYYVKEDGSLAKGWLQVKGKTYYLNSKGVRVSKGWRKIKGEYYYFDKKGVRLTGWVIDQKKRYFADPKKNGARVSGMVTIDKDTYFFDKSGVCHSGLIRIHKKYYYFDPAGRMVTGWQTVNEKQYYFKPTTGERAKGWVKIDGYSYYFQSDGSLLKEGFAPDGRYVDAEGKRLRRSTLKKFLQIALMPVGSTMYVYGGGWNEEDTGAHMDARTMGVSPRWKEFFGQQDSSYNYQNTRYQLRDGLDCSGYVGWVIYNAFNTRSGNTGYVYLAQNMAQIFADKGWGTYSSPSQVSDYRAGDIMSSSAAHVYLVIGECSDGSVVLAHSSPQGVQINGTAARDGTSYSEAVSLATQYMKQYYPDWYQKYPNCSRGSSYLTSFSRMRWNLTGNCMMSDPENYAKKDAAAILKDLFDEE